MKQYSIVRIKKLNREFTFNESHMGTRSPSVGDVATIVDVYDGAFDLECCDSDGCTIWLEIFDSKDAEFEILDDLPSIKLSQNDFIELFEFMEKANELFHQSTKYSDPDKVKEFAQANYPLIRKFYYEILWDKLPEAEKERRLNE